MTSAGNVKCKSKPKNTYLYVILTILLLIIAVLVVILISLRINNSSSNDAVDQEEQFRAELEKRDKSLIDADESYQISLKISEIYNSGEKEKALSMYMEELAKALEKKDYDLYLRLVTARSTMLHLDGTCEESLAQYDTINFDLLPDDYKTPIYNYAINDSTRCKNTEKEQYWRSLANEI